MGIIKLTYIHVLFDCLFFRKVLESKGSLYLGTYAGWYDCTLLVAAIDISHYNSLSLSLSPIIRYSVNDEAFYNEAELVDGKAPTVCVDRFWL